MNSAIYATAAEQGGVGGIYDSISVEDSNVTLV